MKTVFERQPAADSVVRHSLEHTRSETFWLADAKGEAYDALAESRHYDLVIVGAGYTGLWSALLAAERYPGMRICVLEGTRVGWAASGRNGGFVEASLTHGDPNGRSRWPQEIDKLNELGIRNLDAIESAVHKYDLRCDFERTGSLSVALEGYQIDELREGVDGVNSIFLDSESVRAEVNSPTYLAGNWTKHRMALVHPAKLTHELARVCRQKGVEIFENTPVAGLRHERSNGRLRLDAASTYVTADKVILATNAFPSLLKRYKYHTVPVYDYVLMTEPLTAAQMSSIGWEQRQGIADMTNQFHYYRLTSDNRILWGGYDAIYHYGRKIQPALEDRPATYKRLASHFFTTFPQLSGIRFSHKWAGVIDTSTRFCAFFGSAHNGRVAYAAGFTGLGVGATRFAAEVMLDRFAGEETELTQLQMVRDRPLPFPPEPAAWVGINATRWSLNRADHNEGRRNLVLRGLDAVGLGFDS